MKPFIVVSGNVKHFHAVSVLCPEPAARDALRLAALTPDTHHQPQHQRADALADLGRDVVAELLQRRQEALEFAELPCAAGRRQLLVGQRGGGRGARPVAVAVGRGGGAVEGRRRVTAAISYCKEKGLFG